MVVSESCAAGVARAARVLLGTPYLLGHSRPAIGCDCIGVIEHAWREVRADQPPLRGPVAVDYYNDPSDLLLSGAREHLREIDRAKVGAVLVFRIRATPGCSHIGICSETKDGKPHRLIHAHDGRMVRKVVETTLGQLWLPRLAGIFEI